MTQEEMMAMAMGQQANTSTTGQAQPTVQPQIQPQAQPQGQTQNQMHVQQNVQQNVQQPTNNNHLFLGQPQAQPQQAPVQQNNNHLFLGSAPTNSPLPNTQQAQTPPPAPQAPRGINPWAPAQQPTPIQAPGTQGPRIDYTLHKAPEYQIEAVARQTGRTPQDLIVESRAMEQLIQFNGGNVEQAQRTLAENKSQFDFFRNNAQMQYNMEAQQERQMLTQLENRANTIMSKYNVGQEVVLDFAQKASNMGFNLNDANDWSRAFEYVYQDKFSQNAQLQASQHAQQRMANNVQRADAPAASVLGGNSQGNSQEDMFKMAMGGASMQTQGDELEAHFAKLRGGK